MPSPEPTEFGAFILAAMKRQDLKLRGLAARLHKSHGNLSSIINGKTVNNSPARPALEEMDRWADVLGLDPDERKQLVELAELAHTPPAIRERYLAMKAMLSEPQRQAASPAEPYGEGPDMSAMRELERIRNPDEHARPPAPTYPRPTPVRRGTHDRE